MRRFHVLTVLLASSVVASSATASVISYASRFDDLSAPCTTASDYESNWESKALYPATPGYGEATIANWDYPSAIVNNQSLVPGGSPFYIASNYTVAFGVTAAQAGHFDFRFGLDYGAGLAVFVDDVAQVVVNTDTWWNADWNNSQVVTISGLALGAGNHTIEIYGRELSADGPTAGQFSIDDGATWTSFSTSDELQEVPEPTTLLMWGVGAIGCAIAARKKRAGKR